MLAAAGIDTLLVDTGFLPDDICSPAEVAALAGPTIRSHEILRLETTAQDLLAAGTPIGELLTAVGQRLTESEAVGAKSIAAYRCGLDLPGERPRELDVLVALNALRPDDAGAYRITDPTVIAALAWTAIEARLPLQFHVGYGDNDVDLLRCDPLHLTPFLRATQSQSVPVLLLHNYPFHRHAAYLAQVFDHVFMDVGLAVHNTGALSRRVIEETLELVPFSKLLHSSDAFGLPELYLLGTLLFRRGLDEVLEDLVDRDELGDADARRIGAQVAGEQRAPRLRARPVSAGPRKLPVGRIRRGPRLGQSRDVPPDRSSPRELGPGDRPADERGRAADRGPPGVFLYRLITAGQPAPGRIEGVTGRLGAAVKRQVVEVFGQKKLLKWSVPGAAHFFVFWAFVILASVYLEAYGALFDSSFAIPVIGHWAVLGFLQDFIALMALAGIITFAVIRLRNCPERLGRQSRFKGSHLGGAWVVLFMIFNVIWSLFLFRGAASALGNLPYKSGAFMSIAVGNWLDGLDHGTHRGAGAHRPAAPHRHHAGVPHRRGALQAPAHLRGADQRDVRPPADGPGRGRADDVGRQAGHPRRPRGPRRGRQARRRRRRGLHLEGPARLRDLHRVRPLPVAVPGVEHREAALAEDADPRPARPRVREGAVHPGVRGRARRAARRR